MGSLYSEREGEKRASREKEIGKGLGVYMLLLSSLGWVRELGSGWTSFQILGLSYLIYGYQMLDMQSRQALNG